ncbi:MAG: competence protein CoiA family protein [Planctomycetota bacterium]
MSQASVKIPYAERQGEMIHVSQVPRGLDCDCVCPVCKHQVLARKGEQVRHHFAHHRRGECSPETVLHEVGKKLLYGRLQKHLRKDRPLPMQWDCDHCPATHEGNLVKVARQVEMEKELQGCRPDVTLFDAEGNPVAILEVIVSHEPDENVLDYCEKAGVTPVCFRVETGRDLLAFEVESPLRPDRVDLCLRPQCETCGSALSPATLYMLDITCWRCGFQMRAAVVRAEGRMVGPEGFTSRQVELARRLGALLRVSYSSRSGNRYLANTCPTCGAFIGAPYLRYYSRRTRGREGHDAGRMCTTCAENAAGDD